MVYALFCAIWQFYPFPIDKFERQPANPIVTDRHGQRMLSIVNVDGQWRQPVPLSEISPWLIQATLAAEDARFYQHTGVDFQALLRAAAQNAMHQSVVSGASTVTMQLCRQLERPPRTLRAKLWQILRAWQLEKLRSKDQILAAYLNLASYGGNVQGAEAAARWFFDKSAKDLSLGEAALLAGLPQSPNRFRPDRQMEQARTRRQFVLRRMAEQGMISTSAAEQAGLEPIPLPAPRKSTAAPHAAFHALRSSSQGTRTTIDLTVQQRVEKIVRAHQRILPQGSDIAVCVVDIASGDIVTWIGSADPNDPRDGQVDGVLAKRSPGSALKPFLYAAAFQTHRLAPESLIYDGAIERSGWTPENFDHTYSGDVSTADALRRSLNVPAILVTEQTGLARCLGTLRSVGITLPNDAEQRGGLAIAVGGIEVSLLDLVTGYATLGRQGMYRRSRLIADEPTKSQRVLDPDVCHAINDILSTRHRRPNGWESLPESDLPWCVWKTGTSSGRRDAWAVGHNGRFAIGVWAGRFSGTGHVDFVGGEAAEPLLAELFLMPEFRVNQHPVPATPWKVERPFSFPKPDTGLLRITSPTSKDVFLSRSGPAVIHPTLNASGSARWFLNGRLVSENSIPRLELQPGRYELRCISEQGQAAAVEFAVRGWE